MNDNTHSTDAEPTHRTDEQCICGRIINDKIAHLVYHNIDQTDPAAISVYLCPLCQQKLEETLPLSS